jgi:mycofactocin system glycosyltransferase
MSECDENVTHLTLLAYRLRHNAWYTENRGTAYLWLSYPLKFVELNPFWCPVLELFSKGGFILFDDILSHTGDLNRDRVEFFLNDLVRKGFLDQTGISGMAVLPTVTVIVPVYNRPEDIRACLDSLMAIDYPKDKLEILVVDDASTDQTPDIVSRYPVELVRNSENRMASSCRNLAAARSRGDILAFIDSDCEADRMWLRELLPALKDPAIAVVGGMVESRGDNLALDRYEQVRSSLKMGLWPKRSSASNPFFYVPSCNLLIRRDVFLQSGGFNESMTVGEDVDLCWRVRNRGLHIEYRPSGKIFHKHRNRIQSFCGRRFDYGTSEPFLARLYPHKIKKMSFGPGTVLFWLAVVAGGILHSAFLFLLAGIILLVETGFTLKMAERRGPSLPFLGVFISVLRTCGGFFYHLSAFFSRYYLIWSFILLPFFPPVSAAIAGMHLLAGLVEFMIKKPKLNLIQFLGCFTLDQLSYQSGVWWQSLKTLSFRAVNPRIVRLRFRE